MSTRRSFIQKAAAVVAGLFGLRRVAQASGEVEPQIRGRVTVALRAADGTNTVLDEFDTTEPNDLNPEIVTRTGRDPLPT